MKSQLPRRIRTSFRSPLWLVYVVLASSLIYPSAWSASARDNLQNLKLPTGFSISLVTDAVPNARQMALSPRGTLFVGTLEAGSVYAIANALDSRNMDSRSRAPTVIASGLTMPSGVALANGDLYVGALNRILRFADIETNLQADAAFTIVTDTLPDQPHHGWKYLGFAPDGALYIPVGAPCNICLSADDRFASLLRMDLASGKISVYASGIRNTVGFDWHPTTEALWFTDNGRDMLGDDTPPEEVNIAAAAGLHFGYPFLHGDMLPDPEFGSKISEHAAGLEFTPPRALIQAHSAALGVAFYTGTQFPPPYQHALFVAEHGSWNRSNKVGYQVAAITFDESGDHYQPFVTGWLAGEKNWGRPNDVLVAPDGSLLISDDQAGAVYQVRYHP